MGSLLNGFHDMPGYAAQITEYRDHLIAQQDPEDAWDVADAQISAYVVLGLAAVGGPGTDVVIEDAVAWFLTNQLANGGWPAFATPTGQYGAEYSEVDAEAVRALFTLFNTPVGHERERRAGAVVGNDVQRGLDLRVHERRGDRWACGRCRPERVRDSRKS